MNDTPERAQRRSIILRVLWMLVFLVVWQLAAELLLGGLVLVQLVYRLVYGAPQRQPDEFRRQPQPVPGADRPFRHFPYRPETLAVRRLASSACAGRRAPHAVAPAPHPVRDEEPKL